VRGAPVAVLVSVSLLVAAACDRGSRDENGSATTTTAVDDAGTLEGGDHAAIEVAGTDHPRGGSVRVGVWAPPDPASPALGGSAVRALVLPQLFVPRPDGRWSPGVVAPGSDRLAADGLSASFSFRPEASWSNGAPITADDLRRSVDARFVSSVDGPASDGRITLRFPAPFSNWRRLWSAGESIPAPAPDVWGGPFVVSAVTPGLETVVVRNERWWGPRGPFLDEVRLILVPDATTARLLLRRGELDVVMPPAATARTPQLEHEPGVSVAKVERGGWWVALLTNPDLLGLDQRRALFATFDRTAFVSTLLGGEAFRLDGFAGPEDAAWAAAGPGDARALRGETVDLAGMQEEPMMPLVHRSMQKRARAAGGTIELRAAESDRVEGWVRDGTYEAAVVTGVDPPGGPCWQCRWPGLTASGASAADHASVSDRSAVASFEAQLREDARVLPLWRPTTVVAWRTAAVAGVVPNGYAASAAWNAWEWWRPEG
jgi:hypothetical protein